MDIVSQEVCCIQTLLCTRASVLTGDFQIQEELKRESRASWENMRTMLFSHIPFLVLKMRHDVSFQGTLLFWPTGLKNKVFKHFSARHRGRNKLGFKFQHLTSLMTGDCHTNPRVMHWELRMVPGKQGSGLCTLQAPDRAPSPRRAAQQMECSPAALHQGNQPSSSGSVPRAHFSMPLTPMGSEHGWSAAPVTPRLPPCAPLHRGWEHSCTAPVHRENLSGGIPNILAEGCPSQEAPGRPLTSPGREHRPAHARLHSHCSQHTARIIRLSAALARKRRK